MACTAVYFRCGCAKENHVARIRGHATEVALVLSILRLLRWISAFHKSCPYFQDIIVSCMDWMLSHSKIWVIGATVPLHWQNVCLRYVATWPRLSRFVSNVSWIVLICLVPGCTAGPSTTLWLCGYSSALGTDAPAVALKKRRPKTVITAQSIVWTPWSHSIAKGKQLFSRFFSFHAFFLTLCQSLSFQDCFFVCAGFSLRPKTLHWLQAPTANGAG